MIRDTNPLSGALEEKFLCPLVFKRQYADSTTQAYLCYIAAWFVEGRQGRPAGWRFRVRVVDVRLGIERGKGWIVRGIAYESQETRLPVDVVEDYCRETGCDDKVMVGVLEEINEVLG